MDESRVEKSVTMHPTETVSYNLHPLVVSRKIEGMADDGRKGQRAGALEQHFWETTLQKHLGFFKEKPLSPC